MFILAISTCCIQQAKYFAFIQGNIEWADGFLIKVIPSYLWQATTVTSTNTNLKSLFPRDWFF